MRILLLASAFLMIFSTVNAQKKGCSYERDEQDKFTKEHILQTEWRKLTQTISLDGEKLRASALKIDQNSFLLLDFTAVSHITLKSKIRDEDLALNNIYVPAGGELMILMEDGNAITLKTTEEFRGRSNSELKNEKTSMFSGGNMTYKIYSTVEIKFPLTSDLVAKLAAQGSTSIRLNYLSGDNKKQNYDCDFGKRKTDMLQSMVDCIK